MFIKTLLCGLGEANVHNSAQTHAYTCMHTYIYMLTYTYAHTQMLTHTDIRIHTYAHIHAHAHTLAHTHTHTHAHAHMKIRFLYSCTVIASFIAFYHTNVLPYSVKTSRTILILQASLCQQYALPASHALLKP